MAQEKKQSPAMDGVKKGLNKAADMASLKIKLGQAKAKRKAAYTRLGELSYNKYRPRTTEVTADIESAISAAVAEITELTQQIVELELRIKLLKADA
jgi:flagellar biosynthesis chaperone FliJ